MTPIRIFRDFAPGFHGTASIVRDNDAMQGNEPPPTEWATEQFNKIYHGAMDHAIQIINMHIKSPQDAQGQCVDALNFELNKIIEELQSLKK